MRFRRITTAALLLSFGFTACEQVPPENLETDDAAIRAMYSERLERIQGGGDLEAIVDAYLSISAADFVIMPPNAMPVEGSEAVREWLRDFFGSFELDVYDWPMDVLEIGPELAVRRFRSVGNYIPKDGGEPIPYDQKYVDHLRKTSDGRWEIVLHMWSPNDTSPNVWH
jgi:ketosteroid isomerase-like protein